MSEPLNRSINDLHPLMRPLVRQLEGKMLDDLMFTHGGTSGFRLFEGYRSPGRQAELFRQHPKVTKAKAWQSAHQFGLAVDYVWWTGKEWSWDDGHNWAYLASAAEAVGLAAPIKWDRPHIQHPEYEVMKAFIRL